MKLNKSLYALAIAGACSVSELLVFGQGFTALNYASVNTALGFTGSYQAGIEFTTGGSTTSISSVDLGLMDATFSPSAATYSVSLWSSVGGVPTTLIVSDTGVSTTTSGSFGGRFNETLTNVDLPNLSAATLNPLSTYMLVFSNQSAFRFGILTDPGISYSTSGSWTVNGSYRASPTWGNYNNFAISISTSSPSPVPEASGSVAGLGLAVAGLYQLRRRRQNTVTE